MHRSRAAVPNLALYQYTGISDYILLSSNRTMEVKQRPAELVAPSVQSTRATAASWHLITLSITNHIVVKRKIEGTKSRY
jgi:hypothetical protein